MLVSGSHMRLPTMKGAEGEHQTEKQFEHCVGFQGWGVYRLIMANQMTKQIENEMKHGTIWGLEGLGSAKIRGTYVGVPVIKIILFGNLYWASPICGSYHILLPL